MFEYLKKKNETKKLFRFFDGPPRTEWKNTKKNKGQGGRGTQVEHVKSMSRLETITAVLLCCCMRVVYMTRSRREVQQSDRVDIF